MVKNQTFQRYIGEKFKIFNLYSGKIQSFHPIQWKIQNFHPIQGENSKFSFLFLKLNSQHYSRKFAHNHNSIFVCNYCYNFMLPVWHAYSRLIRVNCASALSREQSRMSAVQQHHKFCEGNCVSETCANCSKMLPYAQIMVLFRV